MVKIKIVKIISVINKFLCPELIIGFLILFGLVGCVSPNAVKIDPITEIGTLKKRMDNNEKVTAEQIDNLRQEINQNFLNLKHEINNSGVIKYGGAGWVMAGMGLITLMFLVLLGGLIKFYIKSSNNNSLLLLTTKAIQGLDLKLQKKVKDAIEFETSNGGSFGLKHKKMLKQFCDNNGTFAKGK